ncbi:MAG: Serratia phage [Candidatus Parcubacteria bacterium]
MVAQKPSRPPRNTWRSYKYGPLRIKKVDGAKVFDRDDHSHIHETARPFLAEAVSKIETAGKDFLIAPIDMGLIVGGNACVATCENDKIIFAQRPGRMGLTRFVENRVSQPCSVVTVILKEVAGEYILLTAFIGPPAELEPWHPKATEESKKFWNTHALVWGSEPIIPGTETRICPW